jgi:hypothetical protein
LGFLKGQCKSNLDFVETLCSGDLYPQKFPNKKKKSCNFIANDKYDDVMSKCVFAAALFTRLIKP